MEPRDRLTMPLILIPGPLSEMMGQEPRAQLTLSLSMWVTSLPTLHRHWSTTGPYLVAASWFRLSQNYQLWFLTEDCLQMSLQFPYFVANGWYWGPNPIFSAEGKRTRVSVPLHPWTLCGTWDFSLYVFLSLSLTLKSFTYWLKPCPHSCLWRHKLTHSIPMTLVWGPSCAVFFLGPVSNKHLFFKMFWEL